MDRTPAISRRGFARLAASAAALSPMAGLAGRSLGASPAALAPGRDPWLGLKMGIATYTFRKLSPEQTIAAIHRLGLHYASIKDFHLPLKSTSEQRKALTQKFRDAGITPVSCGVISTKDDETAMVAMFEYARDAGIPTIVCNPTKASLPTLDKMVKEYDIKLAIHNHGPEDKIWPSPLDVWEAVSSLDPRIGLCIDVGHTARTGTDPASAIRTCASRLFDLHIKDIAAPSGGSEPVELGRGVLDLRGILQALLDIKYAYHVGLEYEKDADDPIPGTAESIGYLKGVLSGMNG
ncbi:sugar phosphate isomerase/epimerase family protein [Tundrisphaera lichenicola]|uniref:sugar phosphate isomerase/epimerase family protein n=1 Tax=Tundrisphaera lichenicola TaxID=2029860 RepID=UPI003EBD9788